MKRILLIGSSGQLGWELHRSLAPFGAIFFFDRNALDLTDATAICETVRAIRPEIIVNAGAYTDVQRAETEQKLAMAVNAFAPRVLAEEAQKLGALLVHYSTDYVFDGTLGRPANEGDTPLPLNFYGKSKLEGERAIQASAARYLILRTSWVYGVRGKNFMRTVLRLSREQKELKIVGDQIGAPTWTRMIADATAILLAKQTVDGLYHLTATGETSWFGFAQMILNYFGRQHFPLHSILSSAYPSPAVRPLDSRLDCSKLATQTGVLLPDWKEGFALCCQDAPADFFA